MPGWLRSLFGRRPTTPQVHVERFRSERTGIWTNPDFKPPRDPDWELVEAGRYEEAAARYLALARERTHSIPYWRNRAIALLALQRHLDAHDAFAESDRVELTRNPLHGRALAEMGVCLWLADRRHDALPLVMENLDLRMKNKLTYGDAAGGAWEGLIAYYVGVSFPNPDVVAKALKHLKKIVTRKRRRGWPRPIAEYLINAGSFETMLLEASEAADLETAVAHARIDKLSSRQLSEALFYAAAKHRASGDEQTCRNYLTVVATLPRAHVALEQFLAKHEIDLFETRLNTADVSQPTGGCGAS